MILLFLITSVAINFHCILASFDGRPSRYGIAILCKNRTRNSDKMSNFREIVWCRRQTASSSSHFQISHIFWNSDKKQDTEEIKTINAVWFLYTCFLPKSCYTGWPIKTKRHTSHNYEDAIIISVWGNFSWEGWYQDQQFGFSSLFSRAHFVRQCRVPIFSLFSLN